MSDDYSNILEKIKWLSDRDERDFSSLSSKRSRDRSRHVALELFNCFREVSQKSIHRSDRALVCETLRSATCNSRVKTFSRSSRLTRDEYELRWILECVVKEWSSINRSQTFAILEKRLSSVRCFLNEERVHRVSRRKVERRSTIVECESCYLSRSQRWDRDESRWIDNSISSWRSCEYDITKTSMISQRRVWYHKDEYDITKTRWEIDFVRDNRMRERRSIDQCVLYATELQSINSLFSQL
jgi:hypothetical protein